MNNDMVRCGFYLRIEEDKEYTYEELHITMKGPSSLHTTTPPSINDEIYLFHRKTGTRHPYKVISRTWSYSISDDSEPDHRRTLVAVIVIPSPGTFVTEIPQHR